MKKILFAVFVVGLLFLAACAKTDTKPIPQAPAPAPTPSTSVQSDASVDTVGNAISDVDTMDAELTEDDSAEINSGLDDIESI